MIKFTWTGGTTLSMLQEKEACYKKSVMTSISESGRVCSLVSCTCACSANTFTNLCNHEGEQICYV